MLDHRPPPYDLILPRESNSQPFQPVTSGGGGRDPHHRLCLPLVIEIAAHRADHAGHCEHIEE